MPGSSDILFATSNRHKFLEARDILGGMGISVAIRECDLLEIQSDVLGEIALHKAERAFELCKKPVIVEDDGLYIDCLGGFPGPYSSYVFNTIGNAGILRLLAQDRAASFRAAIAYRGPGCEGVVFDGEVRGSIAQTPRGGGWGYDPIFVPCNASETFAEAGDKNHTSHRHAALEKFASWFSRRQ